MKAMILAAGLGKRMGRLTESLPKPLLPVSGVPLIVELIRALRQAGFSKLVINVSYFAEKIMDTLGDGGAYGVSISYSLESPTPLETAGGVIKALPLLGSDPFLLVSADLWTEYPFQNLPKMIEGLAHLVMVENPTYHPEGDFALNANRVSLAAQNRKTYGNIGIFSPQLFSALPVAPLKLAPLLIAAIAKGQVTGELYQGVWKNVGTPEDLASLQQ